MAKNRNNATTNQAGKNRNAAADTEFATETAATQNARNKGQNAQNANK